MSKEVAKTIFSIKQKMSSFIFGSSNQKNDSDDCKAGQPKRFKINDVDQIASNSLKMAEQFQRIKESLSILEAIVFKSQSNEKKTYSNESEAGPSKRCKKDDSLMIKDAKNVSIPNGLQSIDQIKVKEYPNLKDCFNVSNTYHGDANNNRIHVVNHFYLIRDTTNVITDESSIIIQKTVTEEVFTNYKELLKLIWKYLSFEDKTDCTLVCNRFNDIISEMNCFRLVLQFDSMIQIIPEVSRHYKKLFIQGYHCNSLSQEMHKMLKYLSQSVTHLTLDDCEFDIIALGKFIRELPLLESLKLNVIITVDKDADFCEEDLPNIKRLKDFNVKFNDKLNEILNIRLLTLFDAIFGENLIKYLTKYKNSLTTLSLTKCIMEKPSMSYLNSLHFDSSAKLVNSVNLKIFDCLNNLRELELNKVNNELLSILKSTCVKQLIDCKIVFNLEQDKDIRNIFQDVDIDELYEAMEKPSKKVIKNICIQYQVLPNE